MKVILEVILEVKSLRLFPAPRYYVSYRDLRIFTNIAVTGANPQLYADAGEEYS
jgi:hypothetical protein